MSKKKFWIILILISWSNYYLLYRAINCELNSNYYFNFDNMASLIFIPIIYIIVVAIKIGVNILTFVDAFYFSSCATINFGLFFIHKKDSILCKIINIVFYISILALIIPCYKSGIQNNIIGSFYFISNQLLLLLYFIWFRNSKIFKGRV